MRVLSCRSGIASVQLFLLQLAPGTADGLLDGRRAAPVVLREFSKLADGVLVQPDRERACHALMIPLLCGSRCGPGGRLSELVVEGVGVLAVRADDDLALAADPGQVAGSGRLDDLPCHPRDAVRAARFMLQHEATLAAVQRPVDPL